MDLLRTMLVYMMLLTGTATMASGATPIPYDLLRTPTPVPTATPEPTPTPVLLHVNCHGDEVVQLQARLIELGYLKGKADGFFGPKTEDAVKRFQEMNGLKADGYAGPLTLDRLYNDPAAVPAPKQ